MQPTSKTQSLCMISLATAVIAITAQIALPLPMGVPMTLQSFGIMFAGILLGPKKGTCATIIYLLIGLIGVPVFSQFTGGYQCFVSPTGGFLLSFPILAWLSGLGKRYKLLFLMAGNMVNLFCGALVFCFVTGCSFTAAFNSCVLSFLPITIVKVILTRVITIHIQKRL